MPHPTITTPTKCLHKFLREIFATASIRKIRKNFAMWKFRCTVYLIVFAHVCHLLLMFSLLLAMFSCACLPMFIPVYLCLPLPPFFVHVYLCLPTCLPILTLVYICLTPFTHFYLCLSTFNSVYLWLAMFTRVYLFAFVYLCLQLFNHECLPMLTHVFNTCLPMFMPFYSCLNCLLKFTCVYMFANV